MKHPEMKQQAHARPIQQQVIQRVPPVATVSATVRNSTTLSGGSAQTQGSLSVISTIRNNTSISSKFASREGATSQMRTPFPWMHHRSGSASSNIRGDKMTGVAQQQKPVGVALVSFKAAPSDQPQKETVKSRLNFATHPFPHLAAAAAAATTAKSIIGTMPLKFRNKAELKQLNLTPLPPPPPPPASHPLIKIPPAQPSEPIITDEKWKDWADSFNNEWESFVRDLTVSVNIKRVCRY